MPEPTLADVFGANSSQTATTLTIDKGDLSAAGLTASATNTAESILAAMIKRLLSNLTVEYQLLNPDQSVSLQIANPTIYQSPHGDRYRQTVMISFDSPHTDPGLVPDDY
jgi:hypothetical protein